MALAVDSVLIALLIAGVWRGYTLGLASGLVRTAIVAVALLVAFLGAALTNAMLGSPAMEDDIPPTSLTTDGWSQEHLLDDLTMAVETATYRDYVSLLAQAYVLPIAIAVMLFIIVIYLLRVEAHRLAALEYALDHRPTSLVEHVFGGVLGLVTGSVWLILLSALAPFAPEQWHQVIYVKTTLLSYYSQVPPRFVAEVWHLAVTS